MKNVLLKIALLTLALSALIAMLIVLTKKKDAIKEKGKKVVEKMRTKRAPAEEAVCDCADETACDCTDDAACDCEPVCDCTDEPVCDCADEAVCDEAE